MENVWFKYGKYSGPVVFNGTTYQGLPLLLMSKSQSVRNAQSSNLETQNIYESFH